jgi:malonate-semialdehyde dehydrogenase (acetylating)/methylmalonate-semialdehyde dehydrogenase
VPLAVIALDFEPVVRYGNNAVRLETLALAAAILCGLVLAAAIAARTRVGRLGTDPTAHLRLDDMVLLVLAILPGAVAGGRLGYALLHLDYYAAHPAAILDPGQGSLELSLAVVGGALTGTYAARLIGERVGPWLDVAALPLLVAIGLGKVAMALGGRGQGAPSDAPWATSYVGERAWASLAPAIPSQPSQLYEAIGALAVVIAVAVVLWRRPLVGDGLAFLVALGGWAFVRAVIAATWRDAPVVGPFLAEQLLCLAIVAGCLVAWARLTKGDFAVPFRRPAAEPGVSWRPASDAQDRGQRRITMTQVAEPRSAGGDAHLGEPVNHWIGGRRVAGSSGRRGPVYNPATGRLAREVDFASAQEVDAAVRAAREAFPGWRSTSLSRRTEILFRIRNLVDQHRQDLAGFLTAEHGKVTADALGEVARGIENLEFACGIPNLLKGGFSEQVSTGVDVYQIRQPLGVAAGITPFNFPAMVPMWMFANAIACGNTFVLKPSEKDPSASIFLAGLLKEAGLPDGVFNVVHGDKVAVDRILEHPDIRAVSFVGSTPIARYIYETGTRNGKRVQALGGAKNHMVVLPDADIDMAADAAVSAAYGSAGERCMAISVVVAVGNVADPLVAAIKQRLPKIQVGPGSEAGVEMGPLVTREHRDKVASYLDKGREQGASIVADGRDHPLYTGDGFFLGVSLIDNVTPQMDSYRNEIFGPVLEVVRVPTYTDAVKLVNDNPYGNGTAIFTRDGGAARQFQFEAEVGMVGINVPIPVPVAYYSFGGWKSSLFGDLHMYGPEGIQFYTRGKIVTSRWPDPGSSRVDLGFPRTR